MQIPRNERVVISSVLLSRERSDFLGLFPSKPETVRTLLRKSHPVVMPLTAFHSFLLPLVTVSIHFVPRRYTLEGFPSTSRGKTISLFRAKLLNKKCCLPAVLPPPAS